MTEPTKEWGSRPFEHTADIGLEVWGETLPLFLKAAAEGFIDLMVDPGTVRRSEARTLQVQEDDAEDLLVQWLEEILYLFEAERLTPSAIEVEDAGKWYVRGTLLGETLDEESHDIRNVVKAVTYHDLKVEKTDGLYRARLIFDV